jgi:hypothetical protein
LERNLKSFSEGCRTARAPLSKVILQVSFREKQQNFVKKRPLRKEAGAKFIRQMV